MCAGAAMTHGFLKSIATLVVMGVAAAGAGRVAAAPRKPAGEKYGAGSESCCGG